MIKKISQIIKKALGSGGGRIILENELFEIKKRNYFPINKSNLLKSIAFVDGGQAEIISAGNFCLSFIRVFGQVFQNKKKIGFVKNEFYLFTKAKYFEKEVYFESQIFLLDGERLIEEGDLYISSNDKTIKSGLERASISKISNMARRFTELALAKKISRGFFQNGNNIPVDYVLLDGTLDRSYKNEEKYLDLPSHVGSLAKTSSLFTTTGDNPVVYLNRIGPVGCWKYFVEGRTNFVKLHPQAKHVFRFMGDCEMLSGLMENSNDALFLGYPYGLIFADQMARISNTEKSALKTKFIFKEENREILEYLSSSNAHDILDNMG